MISMLSMLPKLPMLTMLPILPILPMLSMLPKLPKLSKKHSFDMVFDSQKVFRLILEAISNPTSVVNIKEFANKLVGSFPEFLAVAATLLDNETGFSTCGNEALSEEIVSLTSARREKTDVSDFIFVADSDGLRAAIESAKHGSLSDPHKSATVVIRNDGAPNCSLRVSGPGINGLTSIEVSQTVNDAIAFRDLQYYEYPQGIDLIFISESGDLFAIPRLVKVV